MAAPKARSGWAERVEVAVERSAGSGAFEVDDRLRADRVESLADGRLAEARIAVRTDHVFTAADAVARFHSDRRMIVRTKESVLFDGHPVMSRLDWRSRSAGRSTGRRSRTSGDGQGLQLILEHVTGRLGRDAAAQIIGRRVRDAAILDGMAIDPAAWAGASTLVTGLPCVFNLDGVGNCDPVPIEVDDGAGGVRKIHVFADDARPDAVAWTFARTLRYLFYFYNCSNRPVDALEVFALTDDLVERSSEGREALLGSDDLAHALLGAPDTLVAEATSLLEALSLFSAASGVRFSAESEPAGAGVRTHWRIWTAKSGEIRELRLAVAARDAQGQPLYDPAGVPVVELFDDNNLSASEITWDARRIAATAIVVGDVKRYEIEAELLPGWLPEPGLDNVDVSLRADEKSKALPDEQIKAMGPSVADAPWYRMYHRDGAEFSEHWQVGRLWVLNEAGAYADSIFARNAPFDSYAPFDLSAVGSGPWMRRSRRLMPVASPPAGVEQVIVEASFDNGQNWTGLTAGFTVLADEVGLWFNVANLLSIGPGDGTDSNLWYALIDQTCRVRVRALIESDERLFVGQPASTAPSLLRNATVSYAPERFRFVQHLADVGAPAGANGTADSRNRNDLGLMQAVARSLAEVHGNRAVVGRAMIPWLDSEYRLGDRLVGVRGPGVGFAAEREPSERHACVIGKRFHLGPDRFETELLLGPAQRPDPNAEGA